MLVVASTLLAPIAAVSFSFRLIITAATELLLQSVSQPRLGIKQCSAVDNLSKC